MPEIEFHRLTGISVLDGVNPLVDERVIFLSLETAVTHTKVKGIVQERLVIRSDIKNDRQDRGGTNSTSSNVL